MTVPAYPFSLSTVTADYNATYGSGGGGDMHTLANQYSIAWPCSLSDFAGHSLYVNMTLSLSPAGISQSAVAPSGHAANFTGSSTANPTNGAGGYSYNWTYVNGSTAILANSAANGQTMSWKWSSAPTHAVSANWQCTVTDGTGHTVSQQININFEIDLNS